MSESQGGPGPSEAQSTLNQQPPSPGSYAFRTAEYLREVHLREVHTE